MLIFEACGENYKLYSNVGYTTKWLNESNKNKCKVKDKTKTLNKKKNREISKILSYSVSLFTPNVSCFSRSHYIMVVIAKPSSIRLAEQFKW